jgi:rubrerythrin
MAITEPVAIFTATSNIRAHAICHMLVQCGVEAYVTEDFSLVGLTVYGPLPGIHTPKVWIDKSDVDRATQLLQEHERREAELRKEPPASVAQDLVAAECEECGTSTGFPAAQRGSVQECPHCGAYVDVGMEDDDWSAGEDSEAEAAE